MAKVYIETRPKGRPEGSHIDDYVVDDHVDHILATFKTHAKRSISGTRRRDARVYLTA